MALFECKKTGGGKATFSRFVLYDSSGADYGIAEYDVSNIKEIHLTNCSMNDSNASVRIFDVFLDDVLYTTLKVNEFVNIDVENVNSVKFVRKNTATMTGLFYFEKKPYKAKYNSSSTSAQASGGFFDLTDYKTLTIKNTSNNDSPQYRNVRVYLDNATTQNYTLEVGETLTLDVTNNFYLKITNHTANFVKYEVELS